VNVEPEFELRVSLLSQKVPLSGVGAFNIKIVPHNNFATSVTLNVSFSGSLYQIQQECSRINDFDNCGLQCGFDVATPFGIDCGQKTVSAGQTTTLMISPLPPLQSNTVYSFTLHATPCPTNPPCSQDSSTQSKDISFSVAALTGVRNIITLNDLSIKDYSQPLKELGLCDAALLTVVKYCFSIQQNFFVSVPLPATETCGNPGLCYSLRWAQNILVIGKSVLGNIDVWSTYELFDFSSAPTPISFNILPGHSTISLPADVTLTSEVVGDNLYLSSTFNTFKVPLQGGSGGFISRLTEVNDMPQLDVVAGPSCDPQVFGTLLCGAQIDFVPAHVNFECCTDGSVQSFASLDGAPLSSHVTQELLSQGSTGETSSSLDWSQKTVANHSGFSYSDSAAVQGVGFEASTGVGISSIDPTGYGVVGDGGSGVTVTIHNTSHSSFDAIVTSSELTDPPPEGGGLQVPSVGFYDIRVLEIDVSPVGTARMCITNTAVNSASVLEYFDASTSAWKQADSTSVSGATVCGEVPVSALQGSLLAIGDPTSTISLPVTIVTMRPGPPNSNGWYSNETVAATFTSTGTNGIAEITVSLDGLKTVFSGSRGSLSILGEGIHNLIYNASDNAGNKEAPRTLIIKIDSVPPSVSGSLGRSPDHNGWYNHPLSISWSGTDTTSGVSSCDSSFSYTGPNTPDLSLVGSCIDNAGNLGTGLVTLSYDSTPPTIASPQNGTFFILHQTVLANATCTDSLSGTDTCVVPTLIDTSRVGSHFYAVSATDIAGNVATSAIRYDVHYVFVAISPKPPNTRFQFGNTIPVRFQLTDALGNFVSTATAQVWVDSLTTPGKCSGSSNTGNYFRYDSTDNQYLFNLSTRGLTIGQHTIYVTMDDGTTHTMTVTLSSS